jgi:hypothetical protein
MFLLMPCGCVFWPLPVWLTHVAAWLWLMLLVLLLVLLLLVLVVLVVQGRGSLSCFLLM